MSKRKKTQREKEDIKREMYNILESNIHESKGEIIERDREKDAEREKGHR